MIVKSPVKPQVLPDMRSSSYSFCQQSDLRMPCPLLLTCLQHVFLCLLHGDMRELVGEVPFLQGFAELARLNILRHLQSFVGSRCQQSHRQCLPPYSERGG